MVWANGIQVGRWVVPSSGAMEFRYEPTWITSEHARPLSLSLPIDLDGQTIKGDRVGFYFDNLLPDSESIRQRIRARFHTRSGDAFDLLGAVGRDCIGSVQLLPEGEIPKHVFEIAATPLTASQVEQQLLAATSMPSRADEALEDFRISLAGAQEKTAFLRHQGKWCRPNGATPTTHIMKLALGLIGGQQLDMRLSLENEWLCCQLLGEYGLPVAPCELKRFGSTQTLIVTRFDRQLHSSGRYWLRLPQEDFCQATGTPSSLKYESDGGPGIPEIAHILQGSDSRDRDLEVFLRAQLLFWMLAATDGHAKNFSIQLLAEGRYRLTPLYDVISAWPIIGTSRNEVHPTKVKLAMALRGKNKHYRIGEITRQHFNATARQCGLGRDMEPIIADVIAKTPSAIERVGARLPKGFPGDLFETVTLGLQKSAFSLDRTKPA